MSSLGSNRNSSPTFGDKIRLAMDKTREKLREWKNQIHWPGSKGKKKREQQQQQQQQQQTTSTRFVRENQSSSRMNF